MNAPRLFLIDGYAVVYRSYYALLRSPRLTRDGRNTGAVLGFCNTLSEVLRKERPTHIGVAFDCGRTFRHEMFPAYKAQRERQPEDIAWSVPVIKDVLRALGITMVWREGFEADDVIGSLAWQLSSAGAEVYMLTGDKDYGQLVRPGVWLYRPRHGGGYDVMGEREVCAKFDVDSAGQVLDLLALMGDSSDNYPGCPGVGKTTAPRLVREYGGVDGLLARRDEVPGALGKKVRAHVDDILLSQRLARIRTDLDLGVGLDDFVQRPVDVAALTRLFDDLEFHTMIDKFVERPKTTVKKQLDLFGFSGPQAGLVASEGENRGVAAEVVTPQVVDTAEVAAEFWSAADKTKVCVLDGTAACTGDGQVFSFAGGGPCLARLAELGATIVTADGKGLVAGDMATSPVRLWDVGVGRWLINADGYRAVDGEAGASRAVALLQEYKKQRERMERDGLLRLMEEVEMPLVRVLADMERHGVLVDVASLQGVRADMERRAAELEEAVYAKAGTRFNISSPKQVGEVLFGDGGLHLLEKPKRTKTGQYVTNEETLQGLRKEFPIVDNILRHRALRKLLGTYVDALPRLVREDTGHVHTTFNQCGTVTGRLSSSDPNLQNIPVRSEDGREIRKAIVPEPGEWLLAADYSQVELRIMAAMSGDENMIAAFQAGEDVHRMTAARIYNVLPELVSSDQRRHAKTANFGILYGITAFGLSQQLGIGRGEAQQLIDGYFTAFPSVADYIEQQVAIARERGYATTLYGRRRYLPDITSANGTVRKFAERNAVNAPVQGTAADIMKRAMVGVWRGLRAGGYGARLLLQVHDELVLTVPASEREAVGHLVRREMEGAAQLAVPLVADLGWGRNWLEAH